MDLSSLESSISALEKALDSLEFWLVVSTFLVVIGLILEYWHEVKRLIEERPFKWKAFQEIVGALLVTAGVAGELVIQFRASTVETALRSASHKVEALLNKAAADSIKQAGDANKEAGEA